MVLLEYAKACPAAFLPHLEPIAQRLTELSDSAQLRPGEANALREALLAASLAAPESVQASLAEWALAPARAAWTGPEFQASVASPEAFMARYLPTAAPTSDPSGPHVDAAPLRWALYHQVHFVERAVRRMQGAGVSASHPLTAHMAWAVPALLRIVACMNAVHSPAGRAALGAAAAAIDLSPQERALYLKRGAPGARRASAQASSDNPGDFASSGGTSVSSVRVWMRHIREFAFHTLGLLPTHVPPAMDLPGIAPTFAPSAYAFVESLGHQHVRIIIRHVTIPHVKACKARHLESWVLPGLAALAPHMQRRLEAAWVGLAPSAGVESTLAGAPAGEASQVTDEEIIAERLVLELTQEYAELLKEVSTRTLEDPGPPIPAGPAAQGASAAPAPSPAPKPGPKTAAGQGTLLELLLERQPAAGIAAAVAAVAGMQRANDAAFRFAMFCRALVGLAPRDPQLYAYVGSEVLRAAITSLSSEFMASHHADILGLIRAVLVQQLGDPNAAVHSVLQSLPGVTTEREAAFGAALLAMNKEKDQKNAVKEFLLKACGLGSFAALADWRAPSVVPSFGKAKARGRAAVPEDGSDEQLQGDITRALLG